MDFSILPMAGRLGTVKSGKVIIQLLFIVTGCYQLLMLIQKFRVPINLSPSNESTGHFVIACTSGSTASNFSDLVKSWGGVV